MLRECTVEALVVDDLGDGPDLGPERRLVEVEAVFIGDQIDGDPAQLSLRHFEEVKVDNEVHGPDVKAESEKVGAKSRCKAGCCRHAI